MVASRLEITAVKPWESHQQDCKDRADGKHPLCSTCLSFHMAERQAEELSLQETLPGVGWGYGCCPGELRLPEQSTADWKLQQQTRLASRSRQPEVWDGGVGRVGRGCVGSPVETSLGGLHMASAHVSSPYLPPCMSGSESKFPLFMMTQVTLQ